MHLLLTDRLVCPRCGPGFGLILRADRLEDRRVSTGGLGCPNCREVYPIDGGVADLRPPPRVEDPAPDPGTPPDDEEVFRVRALLGLAEGGGNVLLAGRAARFAPGLAAQVPEVELLVAGQVRTSEPGPTWSRLRLGDRLPFDSRSLSGVLLEGDVPVSRLREAARVLAAGGRVVALDAPEGAAGMLIAGGLTVRLDESGVVMADR